MVAGFGPCVLPMLPAVFGYVTGQVAETPGVSGRTRGVRGLALSATFVLGMSLLFASIGAAAAVLGRALLVGAWAYYAVAAICVVLGLQMMGVINLPSTRSTASCPTGALSAGGSSGAFLFGILFGVVASPCSTPILAAIATIAATRGSVPQGALLLFVYGLGKGVPLMLLGYRIGLARADALDCPALPACSRRSAALRSSARRPIWSGSPDGRGAAGSRTGPRVSDVAPVHRRHRARPASTSMISTNCSTMPPSPVCGSPRHRPRQVPATAYLGRPHGLDRGVGAVVSARSHIRGVGQHAEVRANLKHGSGRPEFAVWQAPRRNGAATA